MIQRAPHDREFACFCKKKSGSVSSSRRIPILRSVGGEVSRNLCFHMQDYVLQADGTITPLNSTQNYVLSEQQAGEILAQVFGRVSVAAAGGWFQTPEPS